MRWQPFSSISLYSSCFGVRPHALPNYSVERVRKEAARAAVEAADVPKVPGLLEVALDEAHMSFVVQLVPDSDGLRGEATV